MEIEQVKPANKSTLTGIGIAMSSNDTISFKSDVKSEPTKNDEVQKH